MLSAAESTHSSYAIRSSASAVCMTAIASSKKPMYSACDAQSAGATMRRSLRPDSSSAVDTRTAPSRWQCSSALRHAANGEDTISILRGLRERYEVHHGVRIKDTALVAAAVLSNRYITDRFLPDKAIDLID